jgi:hypothetical protein
VVGEQVRRDCIGAPAASHNAPNVSHGEPAVATAFRQASCVAVGGTTRRLLPSVTVVKPDFATKEAALCAAGSWTPIRLRISPAHQIELGPLTDAGTEFSIRRFNQSRRLIIAARMEGGRWAETDISIPLRCMPSSLVLGNPALV